MGGAAMPAVNVAHNFNELVGHPPNSSHGGGGYREKPLNSLSPERVRFEDLRTPP